MTKNKKVMSIAIRPELHDDLKMYSKRKGQSVSEYVGDLVEKALRIDVDDEPMIVGKPSDEDIKAVVLKIPVKLRDKPDSLKEWMSVQCNGMVQRILEKSSDKPVE